LYGIIAGVFLSFLTERTVASLIFGISFLDARVFLSAIALLTTVAIWAILRPAWLGASMNPSNALRAD
jgi:hypothetical protein